MVHKRTVKTKTKGTLDHDELRPGGDLEPGYMRRIPRFTDVVDIVIARKHTLALQKQLREEIDTESFHRYRVSDEEVSLKWCLERVGPHLLTA